MSIDRVEIKDIALPEGMRRSMSRQAEAERDRRARVISAEGELEASEKLTQASERMSAAPGALQLGAADRHGRGVGQELDAGHAAAGRAAAVLRAHDRAAPRRSSGPGSRPAAAAPSGRAGSGRGRRRGRAAGDRRRRGAAHHRFPGRSRVRSASSPRVRAA